METLLADISDTELVQTVKSGDTAAFGVLVRRYQGLIYGLACHKLDNFADAQDVAQEVFVKAFRSIDSLQNPERFASWLKAIAMNECKIALRGDRRTLPLEDVETSTVHASLAQEDWKRQQKQAEIRQALDSLPEKNRLILTLHYLSGLSHREIGEFLSIPANAVAQQLHRARQQLKQILLSEIEETYTMNRLPESFEQEVLAKLTLYPIKEGYFLTAEGEDGTGGITMAVTQGNERKYITMWMKKDDLGDIVLGTLPARTSETSKGRALDSALQILKALGVEVCQVTLRLEEDRRCRAVMELVQGDSVVTVDMRPSDAMGLAVRAGAAINVEDGVVQKGNVGEGDVKVPDEDMDPTLHNIEYERIRKCDVITDKAFEMVSTDDWVDTVRFRKDEANGVLRMWLEADPDKEITLDLHEYGPGADMIFDMAVRRSSSGKMKGDHAFGWTEVYKFQFSMLGADARMRVIPEKTDTETKGTKGE